MSIRLLRKRARAFFVREKSGNAGNKKSPPVSRRADEHVAERVGFEPTYRLLTDNSISSRARYGQLRYLSARMYVAKPQAENLL